MSGAATGRTCFGYSVQSSLSFCSLRDGEGVPLEVTRAVEGIPVPTAPPLLEWTEVDRPFSRVFQEGGKYKVWIDGIGWFWVDPLTPSIAFSGPAEGPRSEARLWGLPTALCFIPRGDLALHSAAVDVGGSAVVLAAPGRFGKTTLAAAFLQAGHRLLSEDLTCVRVSTGAWVLPGPAMLRVRRDVHARLTLANTTPVAEDPDRVYVLVDESARGDGAPVPLRAIVFLRHADGGPRMERVLPKDSLPDLWTLAFNLPTDADRARCFGAISSLATQVPMWNLHRRLRFDELQIVVNQIVSTCVDG